jgi:D-xylose transport system substrate-binding protein
MRKVLLSALLVSFVIFGVYAGGQMESKTDEVVIGISMPTLQEERWQKDQRIMVEELTELGVKRENILIQSADGDEQKQVTQSENLITMGIDVLIIIPQNGDAVAPVVASAHEAGVKVIAVDRIINNADLDFYVSYDMFALGALQADYIVNKLGVNSGNWILVGGAPTDPNAAVIRRGQMSVYGEFIDSGQINVVLDQPANYWSPSEALRIVEAGLTKANNNVDVVFTTNDGCAGAAIVALEEQGLAGTVPVPGLDAELSACQRIVQGTQSMTVYRKLAVQDQVAAQVAYALATGKDPSSIVKFDITSVNNGYGEIPAILFGAGEAMFAVDAANMKLVIDDEWLTADEIYGNLDPSLWPDWYKK